MFDWRTPIPPSSTASTPAPAPECGSTLVAVPGDPVCTSPELQRRPSGDWGCSDGQNSAGDLRHLFRREDLIRAEIWAVGHIRLFIAHRTLLAGQLATRIFGQPIEQCPGMR